MSFPEIIAHRANGFGYPENTQAAFEQAARAAIDGIETDVWITRDHVPVIQHDPEVVVDGQEKHISDCTRPMLPRSVPTLESTLEATSTLPFINIELKPSSVELLPVLGFLNQPHICTSSFFWPMLETVRKADPGSRLALLLEENCSIETALQKAAMLSCEALHLSLKQLTADTARLIQSRGFAIRIYTANTIADWQRCTELAVDAIMTDRPLALKKWLSETQP